MVQGCSAQCPRRTLFRQWAQAAGMSDVTLGANAAVSESAAPREPAATDDGAEDAKSAKVSPDKIPHVFLGVLGVLAVQEDLISFPNAETPCAPFSRRRLPATRRPGRCARSVGCRGDRPAYRCARRSWRSASRRGS